MKFEFTGETKVEYGVTFHRICKAESKELGGWIEKESNLDSNGTAWVSDHDHARVFGDAWVSGTAQVFGDAWERSPLYIQGSRDSATNCKFGYIAIGCIVKTFAEWSVEYEQIGKINNYSAEAIMEYRKIIELFVQIGK